MDQSSITSVNALCRLIEHESICSDVTGTKNSLVTNINAAALLLYIAPQNSLRINLKIIYSSKSF